MGGKDVKQVMDHFDVDGFVCSWHADPNIIHIVFSMLTSPFLVPGLQYCIHELLEGCW
jgi:hypothetical protein